MTRLGGITLAIVFALGASTSDAKPSTKRHKTSEAKHEKRKSKKKDKKSKKSKKSRESKRKKKKKRDEWSSATINKHIDRPADGMESPAYRYGAMTRDECEAELGKRDVPFVRESEWLGVRAPVRMIGPLHGVTYRTRLSEDQRATTQYEVADCRLVLALDDFAQILTKHDVVEVLHYSLYRPPEASHPVDRDAIRHGGGLALDAGQFVFKDGKVLDVDKHFNGRRGARTCGEDARPRPATDDAKEMRAILCEAVEARIFNSYLTPNYNRAHHNHFHLEVTAGWRSFLVF